METITLKRVKGTPERVYCFAHFYKKHKSDVWDDGQHRRNMVPVVRKFQLRFTRGYELSQGESELFSLDMTQEELDKDKLDLFGSSVHTKGEYKIKRIYPILQTGGLEFKAPRKWFR